MTSPSSIEPPPAALTDVSFSLKRDETVAFVGPSGAGKTTLVKLLVGLYTPESGSIRYNGVRADEIDPDELRVQIGFVTQDAQLFSGTTTTSPPQTT